MNSQSQPGSIVLKRAFDLFFSALGLLFLGPVLLLIALIVKLSDGGPVFFLQSRVGQGGRLFPILKFRSMVVNAEKLGPSITAEHDHRITPIGRFLRKHKLDELPQLWNVLRGDMSFVGPRPEVPRYVAKYTPNQKHVLALKPGITDLATLEFRNEEELLRKAESENALASAENGKTESKVDERAVEEFYLEFCMPRKIELNLAYAARANLWTDFVIILRTLFPFLDRKLNPALRSQTGHVGRRQGRARPLGAPGS